MGKQFDVLYNDFTGGHFVGHNEMQQPRNTWTGTNVVATPDEGFLMADGGWSNSAAQNVGVSGYIISPCRPLNSDGDSTALGTHFILLDQTATTYPVKQITPAGVITTRAANLRTANWGHACLFLNAYVAVDLFGPFCNAMDLTSGAVTSTAIPILGSLGVWAWKDWLVYTGYNTNKVYFSAPQSLTSFPSTNYFTVGHGAAPIRSMIPTQDALYVETGEGWYAVTGVLGSTTTVRKVADVGVTFDGLPVTLPSNTMVWEVAKTQSGLVAASGDGLSVLRGSHSTHFASFGEQITAMYAASVGSHLMVCTGTAGELWVYDEVLRNWRKTVPPAAAGLVIHPAESENSAVNDLTFIGHNTSALSWTWFRQLKNLVQPLSTSGVFDSATVSLVNHVATDRPFRVKQILVEVDFGRPAVQTGKRSITVQAITDSVVDIPARQALTTTSQVSLLGSSAQTFGWQAQNATRNGHRQMLRFDVNDGNVTFAAFPRITMQGVKVRRVIMRCEEQS